METATAHISRRCRPFIASAVVVSALLRLDRGPHSRRSGTSPQAPSSARPAPLPTAKPSAPRYGWPVKPFNRQHPVRAYLNDPRNGHGDAKSFHFGVDITAPTGSCRLRGRRRRGLPPARPQGGRRRRTDEHIFGYWHVKPAVRNHQIVRLHQLLGHIVDEGGGAHVHFAERDRGHDRYLNPLRPGAIGPYVDRTPPRVVSVEFLRNGREVDANALTRPRRHRRRGRPTRPRCSCRRLGRTCPSPPATDRLEPRAWSTANPLPGR